MFEVAKGSNSITMLGTFAGTNGSQPQDAPIIDVSGDLFGTASTGGQYNDGTIFEVAKGSNSISTVVSFNGTDGADPQAGLTLDASGNLFGAADSGGQNQDGVVFEIPKGSTTLTDLASLTPATGSHPMGAVALDAMGDIYGTGDSYGGNWTGTIFEIVSGSHAVNVLSSFDAVGQSLFSSGVTRDAVGNLFGTTKGGGYEDLGTIFEIPAGSSTVDTLATFDYGAYPNSGVTIDSVGNLFGTTLTGGPLGYGTIFEVARGSSTITTLASFNGADGEQPKGKVVIDAAGILYGTTYSSTGNGDGEVFKLLPGAASVTPIGVFDGANGANPVAGVTLDSAGDVFGTTSEGGPDGIGTVFEIAHGTNTLTTLSTFTATGAQYPNGEFPKGWITLDSAGNLYGTTTNGGANNMGTIFEIPKGSNAVTTLVSFDGTNGSSNPYDGLTLDPAGNLYGTTWGTVFELPSGSSTIETLFSFNGADGFQVYAGVTLDPSGNLYGTTSVGGPVNGGTVFELVANSAVKLSLTGGSNPANDDQSLGFTASVAGGVPDGETVTLVDASSNDAVVASGTISNGSTALTIPGGTLAVGTHSLIAVYGGDANFAASESAPYVQTVNSDPLPSYITASTGAIYGYNSVTGALNLTSGTLTFTADSTSAPLVNLTASGPASGLFFDTSEHLAGIALSGGAQATVLSLGASRTHSNHNVLVLGTPGSTNDPTFSIDSRSKLDLLDNDLIIHTGTSDANGASAYASIEALAANGRNPESGAPGQPDGQWNGNGLSSSAAAAADATAGYEQIGLAVVVNSSLLMGAFSSWQVGSFNEPLGANDIIVKYDYLGDYALEGEVSADDAGILQLEYDNGSNNNHTWATGSSLYDGLSDDTEAGLFQLQYGLGTGGSNGQQL